MEALVDIKKQGVSAFTPFAQINPQTILEDAVIPALHNATSIGPLQIDTDVTVTVGTGSNWSIT